MHSEAERYKRLNDAISLLEVASTELWQTRINLESVSCNWQSISIIEPERGRALKINIDNLENYIKGVSKLLKYERADAILDELKETNKASE